MQFRLHHAHSWKLAPKEARQVQESLRDLVRVQPLADGAVRTVCGVDAAYTENRVYAAVVVLAYPSLQSIALAQAEMALEFPYIPGLLSFREAPAILAALGKLGDPPDLLLVDGHGLAHPRRFGLACHLGVLLDLPTIGVAKSILVGKMDELGTLPGSAADLVAGEALVGVALRTRLNTRPVYLSVGHRVDLPSCVRVAMGCARGYRMPEPCRLAHLHASKATRTG